MWYKWTAPVDGEVQLDRIVSSFATVLAVYNGSALGTLNQIAANDNWGGDPQITAVSKTVGAFALTDPNSKDAALLVTLPPGVYTAQVSGADGGTGVALVEVYDVP